jgi:hypothetical protein
VAKDDEKSRGSRKCLAVESPYLCQGVETTRSTTRSSSPTGAAQELNEVLGMPWVWAMALVSV